MRSLDEAIRSLDFGMKHNVEKKVQYVFHWDYNENNLKSKLNEIIDLIKNNNRSSDAYRSANRKIDDIIESIKEDYNHDIKDNEAPKDKLNEKLRKCKNIIKEYKDRKEFDDTIRNKIRRFAG